MGRSRRGIVWEFGMDTYTLLYLKWITNKDLLYSTRNSVQCCVAAWTEVGSLGENGYMYMCGWIPSLFTWSYHSIVNHLYPNTKRFIYLFIFFKSNVMGNQMPGFQKVLVNWSLMISALWGSGKAEIEVEGRAVSQSDWSLIPLWRGIKREKELRIKHQVAQREVRPGFSGQEEPTLRWASEWSLAGEKDVHVACWSERVRASHGVLCNFLISCLLILSSSWHISFALSWF